MQTVFKIIETELNLLHDVIHTKVFTSGVMSRLLSFVLLVVAFFVFIGVEKRYTLSSSDVGITYSLFVGAISLDVLSFIMFVYSDWGAIALIFSMSHGNDQSSSKILKLLHPSWFSTVEKPHQRWSESISQYNLIQNSMKRVLDDSGPSFSTWINNAIEEIQQVKTKRFDLRIGEAIFYVLHKIASMPIDLKKAANEICLSRGSWLLEKETNISLSLYTRRKLVEYIKDIEYEESIILWHVATNICYFTFEDEKSGKENSNIRESCMVISNYMLYLLLKDPTMISAMAGTGQLIYGDTKAALVQMIHSRRPESHTSKEVCEDILNVETKGHRIFPHGMQIDAGIREGRNGGFTVGLEARMNKDDNDEDKSKSVLSKAKGLAEKLRELNAKERWEVMNEVWVGIMIHAASGCKATNHVGQLAKGGQLITIVWLLMAHLGLGMHFMENERVTLPQSIGHIDLTKAHQQNEVTFKF